MENSEFTSIYIEWIILVGTVIILFNILSKKLNSPLKLFFSVFFASWLIQTIVVAIFNDKFSANYVLTSLRGFISLMAYTLPTVLLIGGITYTIIYFRFKKKTRFSDK